MFVRGVVIRNEIQSLIGRRDVVDDPQELQPFLMPMSLLAHADDGAIEDVESGKQAGRPVALVVVGHGLGPPGFQRQPGLGTIQRLGSGSSHRPIRPGRVPGDSYTAPRWLPVSGRSRGPD